MVCARKKNHIGLRAPSILSGIFVPRNLLFQVCQHYLSERSHKKNYPTTSGRVIWSSYKRSWSSGWWFEPLWKIIVNWDDYSQYMRENKKCSKPPTSHGVSSFRTHFLLGGSGNKCMIQALVDLSNWKTNFCPSQKLMKTVRDAWPKGFLISKSSPVMESPDFPWHMLGTRWHQGVKNLFKSMNQSRRGSCLSTMFMVSNLEFWHLYTFITLFAWFIPASWKRLDFVPVFDLLIDPMISHVQ